MAEQDRRDLLEALCLAPGPPGGEDAVRDLVRTSLQDAGTLSHDRLGSVLCEVPGSSAEPRVVVDSHLDEVGFMIQSVTADGRLPFVPLGGWWGHVLLGQRVDILAAGGTVPAVVGCKPPHFLSRAEREKVLGLEQMYLDVGASSRAQVDELGVRVGDMAVPHAPFADMAVAGVVSAKALDNRIGVALMIETLRHGAENAGHPNTLIGVAAAQEEVGLRGARTASTLARPDIALVLECTPADDLPGVDDPQGRLGGGPQLRFFDPTAVANRRFARWLCDLADSSDLPLQRAVRRSGGTNAGAIHGWGEGVPTAVLGVPARYIHSHVSLMQWSDYDAAARLVREAVAKLDASTVAGFTNYQAS
jgi:endoglucanase